MAYDDATGTVVLLTSGNLGTGAPDTWTWDGTDWTEHPAATMPGSRWSPSLAFDTATNSVILFGGSTGYQGSGLADTWSWDGSNWTQLSPAASPPARAAATMDYVPAARGLVLFGSDHGATDTWLYSGGTWTRTQTTATPPGRGYAVSAYDPVEQAELVAFGGQGGQVGQPLGDLWFLNAGTWSTTVPAPVLPPATSVAISPGLGQSAPAGQSQTVTVSATGSNGQPLAGVPVQVQISGPDASAQTVTTNSSGVATVTDPGAGSGVDQIQATASVSGTTVVSNQVPVTETAPPNGPPPAISGTQPGDGTVVRAPVPVTTTLTPPSGQSIASWSVTAQSGAPGSAPFTLASGTGTPPATLATFDPTALVNGQYNLTISATASGGGVQTQTTSVSVAGALKLGGYQATYHETTLPVGGLSMTVDRDYNSQDRSPGDFGTGWRVDISNFQVATGRTLGEGGWQEYPGSCSLFGLLCSYDYVSQGISHAVTVTWPDGHQEVWDLTPQGSSFFGYETINALFTPRPGTDTVDTLSEGSQLAFGDDGNMYNSLYGDYSDGTLYDPTQFTLTARDGTTYLLDTTYGLVRETSPSGASITIDGNGVHGSNGKSLTFVRDAAHGNRITEIVGPDDGVNGQNQHWAYGYNSAGELSSVTDPIATVNYSYDPTSGLLLKSTDANNQPLVTITYDPAGRMTSIAHGTSPPTAITTDSVARSQTISDPNGKLTTTRLYDASGDLVENDATAGGKTLKTTYVYDAAGRQTQVTDPMGNVSSTVYDETPGSSTEGDILSETDTDGHTWTFGALNQNGQPGEAVNPDGSVAESIVYDPVSLKPASVDEPGLAPTKYTYNPDGTTASITDQAGRKVTYSYDANGYENGQADSAGDKVQYTNDASGHPIREIDQSGNETDYTYDGDGNVTAITMAGTSATRTAHYNLYNEPDQLTDANRHSTTYTYDQVGRVLTRTDADNNVTTYAYDADGNLTTKTTPTDTVHYGYDGLRRLVEADDAARQYNYTYDDAGRLLTQTSCARQANGQPCPSGSPAVSDTLDPAGLITSTAAPSGKTSYTYNPNENLATVTDPSGGVFVYGYDTQGRQASIIRPNQTADLYTYNDVSQPLSLTSTGPGGAVLAKGANTLDPVTGQITEMIDLAGTNSYTYNPNGTLASATHPGGAGLPNEAYTYDSAQNRITGPTASLSSTYDSADQLKNDGTASYTWNGEGEPATKTVTATGVTTTYTWDADGRLLGTSDTAGNVVTNAYDPFGRLATQTAGGTTTTYLWDRQTLLSQSTGSTTTNMVTEPAVVDDSTGNPQGEPATTLEIVNGGVTDWLLYNLHGDVTSATDANGALTQPIDEYSAFGTPASANALPLGFDGYLNTAGGLDYAPGRDYDPATGRFLAPDPLPAINPYSYAGNSPISHVDPTGQEDDIEGLAEAGDVEGTLATQATSAPKNNFFYIARDALGKCYAGITNNVLRRTREHGSRFVSLTPLLQNLTREQAKIVEQEVIENVGFGRLLNEYNSIAPDAALSAKVGTAMSFADIGLVLDMFSLCRRV